MLQKRLLAVILSVALAAFLFGCSPAPSGRAGLDPKNPIIIEVWHYYNGPQKAAFDSMVSEFNESEGLEKGIIVESYSQGNVTALSNKVLSSARGEAGADRMPDLFAAYADAAYEVDALGKLANLDNYFTSEELNDYRADFVDMGRFTADGVLKIFPIARSVELLMLNLSDWEKFAADTGAELDQLATLEGVTKAAEAYYNWSGGKALFGRDAMANYMLVGARQLGDGLFVEKDGVFTVQAEDALLRKLWDNYYIPMLHGWFSANGRFRSDAANLGDIIALVGSSTAASYFPEEVTISDYERYPIQCAIFPAPGFSDGAPFAVQQGAGMAVTAGNPTREYASALFLKWFTHPERNARFAAASGSYLPVTKEALQIDYIDKALRPLYPDEDTFERMHKTFSAALEAIDGHILYSSPPFPGNLEAREILERSMNDLAVADRQAVLDMMAQGVPEQEALSQFITDGYFSAWAYQFRSDLEAVLQAASRR